MRTGDKTSRQIRQQHLCKYIRKKSNKPIKVQNYVNSAQNFNKVIKRICKKAGICEKVLVEHTRGGKVERKKLSKYNLVCSHTARRSFATNAYLAGISTFNIMLITGHRTEESFFRYIKISKSENAKSLLENDFFK